SLSRGDADGSRARGGPVRAGGRVNCARIDLQPLALIEAPPSQKEDRPFNGGERAARSTSHGCYCRRQKAGAEATTWLLVGIELIDAVRVSVSGNWMSAIRTFRAGSSASDVSTTMIGPTTKRNRAASEPRR